MAKMKIGKRALAVQHGVSRDPMRYILHCVQVTPTRLVATDGRILMRIRNEADQPEDAEGEVLLTKETASFVKKMFGASSSYSPPVTLETVNEGRRLKVEGFGNDGGIKLETQHPEGNFPDYEKVVPKETEHKFTLDVKILEKAIKAAKAAGAEGLSFWQEKDNKLKPLVLKGMGKGMGTDAAEIEILIMPMRYE